MNLDLWHARVEVYPVSYDRAPFGLTAKLGKLDEILVIGGDSSLNPTLTTKPDIPLERCEVSDEVEKLRARTTGDETYTDLISCSLHQRDLFTPNKEIIAPPRIPSLSIQGLDNLDEQVAEVGLPYPTRLWKDPNLTETKGKY